MTGQHNVERQQLLLQNAGRQQLQQLHSAPRRKPDGQIAISGGLLAAVQGQRTGSKTNFLKTLRVYLPAKTSHGIKRLQELWPVFHGNEPIPEDRQEYLDILTKDLVTHCTELCTYKKSGRKN